MKYKYKYLMIIIILPVFLLGIGKTSKVNDNSIYKNIYIEDVNISSMTIKDAYCLIQRKYEVKDINLNYNNKMYKIKPEDIDLNFNIDKAIKEAYLYTRSKSNFDNLKRKISLNTNNNYTISLLATYNEQKLTNIINKICKDINVVEKDATISVDKSNKIIRTKSKNGKEVDKVRLKENIYDMIKNKKLKDANIPVNIITPKISTEDVNSIDSILGQFSTTFNHNTSRGSNIYVAAKDTSDILIMPHIEFSYNKATGARTWHNGYKTAKVIVGGKYVNGEGGGVCQVSTTIYNACLLSGMDITEVHNHTFISRYAPAGRDAAVSYGYTDFKFKNPLKHPIYVKNIVNKGVITSKIYGCSSDRENIYITTKNSYEKEKIEVDTYRVYLDEEGNKIREELINKNIYKKK